MKRKKYFLPVLSCFIILLFACKQAPKKGGIIFSFDDNYINEWFEFKKVFNKYQIKATFFIAHSYLLDSGDIQKLKILEKEGHEIGCHGYRHLNCMDYVDSIDKYVENEIIPAVYLLEKYGFQLHSFAYPFGPSTDLIDSALLTHFDYIRKATYNINDTTIDTYDDIFVSDNKTRISNAMGIDYNYNISFENLETALERAANNNEILILYAHKIDDSKKDYSIEPAYLEKVFQLCNKYGLQSIRMKDIGTFTFK
ncbi:MAG: polysaccharide deacetylase family protein [Bacteroidales bacterium]|nr:polysaccharide deacetylase family protein [Bacteroidales bacterium]